MQVDFARDMVMILSSSGYLRTSRILRLNSGSSSRNRTPLWPSDISRGCGNVPPPTSATSVIVSNEGGFYKFIMQIKINREWSSIEVLNTSNA
jgi:hypothetical protein